MYGSHLRILIFAVAWCHIDNCAPWLWPWPTFWRYKIINITASVVCYEESQWKFVEMECWCEEWDGCGGDASCQTERDEKEGGGVGHAEMIMWINSSTVRLCSSCYSERTYEPMSWAIQSFVIGSMLVWYTSYRYAQDESICYYYFYYYYYI